MYTENCHILIHSPTKVSLFIESTMCYSQYASQNLPCLWLSHTSSVSIEDIHVK